MPKKRPKQHVINTKSENMLRELLPDEWTCETITNDYGLDFMIEIFEDGFTTGNQFFIQLKGTTQSSKDNSISWSLDTDSLDYYGTLTLPVLLIITQVDEGISWGKWINNVEFDSSQKTKSIRLYKDNILKQESFYDISSQYHIDMKNNIKLDLRSTDDKSGLYNERLMLAMDDFYKEKVSVDNQLATQSITVNTSYKNEKFYVNIEFLNMDHIEEVELTEQSVFLYIPYDDEKIQEELIKPLYTISLLLLQLYTKESINVFKRTFFSYEGSKDKFDGCTRVITSLLDNGLLSEYQEIINIAIDKHLQNEFAILNTFWLPASKKYPFIKGQYVQNLLKYRENIDNEKEMGMNSYNIANHYRGKGDLRKASKFYFDAAKREPDYTNRAYFWKELAGVMFLLNKYRCSEKFYKKSKTLQRRGEEEPIIDALIADTLIFQRKFKDAIEALKEFVNSSNELAPEYRLKGMMVRYILDNLGEGPYNPVKSVNITRGYRILDTDEQLAVLTESVAQDPLNKLSWFNLAHVLILKNDTLQARNAYLVCALLNREEEALIQAIILTLNLAMFKEEQISVEEMVILKLEVSLMNKIFGKEGIGNISKKIMTDNGGPTTEAINMIQELNKVIYSIASENIEESIDELEGI